MKHLDGCKSTYGYGTGNSNEPGRWFKSYKYPCDCGTMIDVNTTLTNEERMDRPMLKLITGGKGTPPGKGENWLSKLNKAAVFTCKRKGTHTDLELFIVAFKHEKTIVLVDGLNSAPRRAVDPEAFCNQYSLFEIIEEGGEHPEESQDDSSGTLRSSGVEDDVDAPGRQPKHEET